MYRLFNLDTDSTIFRSRSLTELSRLLSFIQKREPDWRMAIEFVRPAAKPLVWPPMPVR